MNALVMVAIGRDKLLKHSLPPAREYCKNYGIDISVIKKPHYNIGVDDSYNYLTFEKNQIHDYFQKYDQVLRIDCDVLVKPSAPNIFDFVPMGGIGAVMEDVRRSRRHRKKEIRRLQEDLGKQLGWDEGYFNSGVIVASENANQVFDISSAFIEEHSRELGPFKEQSLMNFKVREHDLPVVSLSPEWNRMSMFDNVDKGDANFIHYAGPPYKEQVKLMKKDINEYL